MSTNNLVFDVSYSMNNNALMSLSLSLARSEILLFSSLSRSLSLSLSFLSFAFGSLDHHQSCRLVVGPRRIFFFLVKHRLVCLPRLDRSPNAICFSVGLVASRDEHSSLIATSIT